LTGVFSYLFAAGQEVISGRLIHYGDKPYTLYSIGDTAKLVETTVHQYDFSKPIIFWIGSSILSVILAASLWRTKVRE